jgi:hypothetical protein
MRHLLKIGQYEYRNCTNSMATLSYFSVSVGARPASRHEWLSYIQISKTAQNRLCVSPCFKEKAVLSLDYECVRWISRLFIMFSRPGRPTGVWTTQVFCCRLSALTQSSHFCSALWRGEGAVTEQNGSQCWETYSTGGSRNCGSIMWMHLDRVQKVRSSNLDAWSVRMRRNS